MGITFKKSFTIIEVLFSIILLSLIVLSSLGAYKYIVKNSKINELRYLVLNKINTEMTRLVYAYENLDTADFVNLIGPNNTNGNWDDYFDVPKDAGSNSAFAVYNDNPLNDEFGLFVYDFFDNEKNNIVEIIDKSDNPNIVDSGDIVGLLAWKVNYDSNAAHLSLSITYPYKAISLPGANPIQVSSFSLDEISGLSLETINIKTSTKVK